MKVGNEDRLIIEPLGLHDQLQSLIGGGRFIIRPSGTEDMIRLYIEHPDKDQLENLMKEVKKLVETSC
jgi:phosphomannomutase